MNEKQEKICKQCRRQLSAKDFWTKKSSKVFHSFALYSDFGIYECPNCKTLNKFALPLSEDQEKLIEQARRNIEKSGSDEPDVFEPGEPVICKYCKIDIPETQGLWGTGQMPDGRGYGIYACLKCYFLVHVISDKK